LDSVFEKFAEAFPLASDEDERWSTEGRLISELARTSGEGKGRVLDLACGSGFHARHLAAEGLEVTAVDISAGAIEVARLLPGGDRVRWVVGDILEPVAKGYDLALVLGNTLSLFDDEGDVKRAIAAAAGALVDQGVLAIHIIDFAYLRQRPVEIVRGRKIAGDEVTFRKTIEPDEAGALITVTVTTAAASGPATESGTQRLSEWGSVFLIAAAKESGLVLRRELGGLDGPPISPGLTRDVVLVFEKADR